MTISPSTSRLGLNEREIWNPANRPGTPQPMSAELAIVQIGKPGPASDDSLLATLLRDQQTTAVGKFSQWHEKSEGPLLERHYRDLIPLSAPKPGEQYAFEVDLDACSGCKACVVACHNLNGLEERETWRSVGLLHGGSPHLPVIQHVTTACHHCVEPGCLSGCPVNAYEKHPVTGIVRHLDDQCIGCQYCILKCPYDVPKYSHSKGIVRKCDMCSDRLVSGEAPACVQSCPNQAIRITLVNKVEVADNAEANLFLPGAPEPSYTLPTTVYKTNKPLPANLLPADYFSATSQHAHWSLIFMLVLTQMSVGAFIVDQIISGLALSAGETGSSAARRLQLSTAFVLGMIGLMASTFHLGRPLLAYRAFIGWRTSWLSREVIAFGAFAAATTTYAAIPWLESFGVPVLATWERIAGAVVAIAGLAGVGCSTMIYASTRRVFWNPIYTGLKFLLTCATLGIPVALLIRLLGRSALSVAAIDGAMNEAGLVLCEWLIAAVALKLVLESAIFLWLYARTFTPLRRTALLMTGDLFRPTAARFIVGGIGGIVIPGLIVLSYSPPATPIEPLTFCVFALLIVVANFAGEILERFLFFAAVVAPKMPGAPAS